MKFDFFALLRFLAAHLDKAPAILAAFREIIAAKTPNERAAAIVKLLSELAGILTFDASAATIESDTKLEAFLQANGVDVDTLRQGWASAQLDAPLASLAQAAHGPMDVA